MPLYALDHSLSRDMDRHDPTPNSQPAMASHSVRTLGCLLGLSIPRLYPGGLVDGERSASDRALSHSTDDRQFRGAALRFERRSHFLGTVRMCRKSASVERAFGVEWIVTSI